MTEELSHVGMSQCFFCLKPKNEIVLDRRLKQSLPPLQVYNHEPCDDCKKLMEQGVILVSIRDGESTENPYRTGLLCAVKDAAIKDLPIDAGLKAHILKSRFCFIEDTVWKRLGLPTTDIDNRPKDEKPA